MNKKHLSIFLLTALLMAACDVGQYPSQYSPQNPIAAATESAYQAANNAATVDAYFANQTAVAVEATRTSQEIASGTAAAVQAMQDATAVVIQATDYAIAAQGTTQALSGQATADTAVFNATGTIAAAQAAAFATAEFARAEAQIQIVAEEAERLELANREDEAAITRSYITTIGTFSILFVLSLGAVMVIVKKANRDSRPVVVGDGPTRTILVSGSSWMATAPPALPAPVARPLAAPAPDQQRIITLPPLAQGHVLIAGETGSGKSTAVRAALQRRQNVVVLDPHYEPGSWGNVKVIGAGRDFDSIEIFMGQMRELLSERYAARSRGQASFSPMTVATDEMPAIITALGRDVGDAWREWLREGRKVGLFFIASTQSTRVRTLGIEGEGDLLENFAYILLLGKVAAEKYPGLVSGMERPAVIQTVSGARPVRIPLIEPTGGGEVIRLAQAPPTNGHANGHTNGHASATTVESLIAQYRDQIEDAYWQHVRQHGEEPSKRLLEESIIGYAGGQAHRVVSEVLEQMKSFS